MGDAVGFGSDGSTGVGVIFGSTGVAVGAGVGVIIGSTVGIGTGVISGSGVGCGVGVAVGVGMSDKTEALETVVEMMPETRNKNVVAARIVFFNIVPP